MKCTAHSPWRKLLALALGCACLLLARGAWAAELPFQTAGIIQSARLEASKPLFVPTHPRVTTTIRFPGGIGAPEGRGFTEDEVKIPGEYLVCWAPGESHFTITPLAGAGALNLNVPYQNSTYVLYFYPVERQFEALASLILTVPGQGGVEASSRAVTQTAAAPSVPVPKPQAATPAQLLGFLDKLKLLRAAPAGVLARMAAEMGLDLASPRKRTGAMSGLLGLQILQVLRDKKLNCIGFMVTLSNQGRVPLVFDLGSAGVRSGARHYPAVLSDIPPSLGVKESCEAYLVLRCVEQEPLLADNEWTVSLDLLSPRLNPGAGLVSDFALQKEKP